MQQSYAGRVTLILVVLLAALWAIFPSLFRAPHQLFDPDIPFNQKHALRPGIDMVGGVSLLYEIRVPEGSPYMENLAEQVMESLKRRVDPDGVRNLIWRPQGNTRLEIQMPLTRRVREAAPLRDAFVEAQRQVEATNVRRGEIIRAVQTLEDEAQQQEVRRLAMGSAEREDVLQEMLAVHQEIEQASEAQDAARQADAEIEYERLMSRLLATNIDVAGLESIMELAAETREQRLAELQERFADFPDRLEAIEQFQVAFAAFAPVRGEIDDAAELKRLLRGSGVLQFHILVHDFRDPEAEAMVDRLQRRGPRVEGGDRMRWFQIERPEEFGWPTVEYNDQHWALVWTTLERSMVNREGQPRWALERAFPTVGRMGERVVGFRFDPQGGRNFRELTRTNIGEPLAVVLDERIISAPRINSEIGRDGIIDGGASGFRQAELQYLISTLNAGSLPAQLTEDPISERTVGPQLGQDNLRRGLIACMAGLVVVAVFLIGYYYLAGLVAFFAVAMAMVMILGAMAALNATFTLPGVAAVVLTIGMAVDANVLIFERLREEQNRGLSLRMAIKNAYDKAFSAIFDSNVTTAITALILYWFGSEEVRGFGITLIIGLASSFFTAMFVTRTIFGLMIDRAGLQNLTSLPLTFPAWDRLLTPDIDWMGKVKYFAISSVAVIVVGLSLFGVKWGQGQILDIEFTSGTSVQFDLVEPMAIGDVRALVTEVDPAATVVSVGHEGTTYEVVTPDTQAEAVRDAVLAALGDRLRLERPSRFDDVGQPLTVAMANQVVVPIEDPEVEIAGFVPEGLTSHLGGVAIVLNNLDPPLTPGEIEARLERQRLQPRPGEATMTYRDFTVESPSGPAVPTDVAVVLVSDPDLPYDRDPVQWQAELAGPMWTLVDEAVHRPAELQRVNNFDAQVAGEARQAAMLALTLAIIVIMAYIWFRFGNLKFGTATVMALVHDTLFVVAAIGFAHYLAGTLIGNTLLIDPFRINLTMIAAILTVIGYSMNDTIVIFDRIRENRGKYGHLGREVINKSINQTLSRTLLTSGTTLVVLLVMYIFGGPGIHGFTYALLIGILVGTYSSIAIAAPILLLGAAKEPAAAAKPVGTVQRAGA